MDWSHSHLPIQNQNVVLEPVFKRNLQLTKELLVELKQVRMYVIAGLSSLLHCLSVCEAHAFLHIASFDSPKELHFHHC